MTSGELPPHTLTRPQDQGAGPCPGSPCPPPARLGSDPEGQACSLRSTWHARQSSPLPTRRPGPRPGVRATPTAAASALQWARGAASVQPARGPRRRPGSGSVSSLPCVSEEGGRDGGCAGAAGTTQVAGPAGRGGHAGLGAGLCLPALSAQRLSSVCTRGRFGLGVGSARAPGGAGGRAASWRC